MKLFGYPDTEVEQGDSGASVLSEAILSASPEELRKIASFLAACADEMERMGSTYDHIHLSDRLKEFEDSPQLVVVRAQNE